MFHVIINQRTGRTQDTCQTHTRAAELAAHYSRIFRTPHTIEARPSPLTPSQSLIAQQSRQGAKS